MAKKSQIGDVLEIPTKRGLAYVQFSHYHEPPPHFGSIIRVLPGFFQERPKNFQAVVDQKELYYTLFPVRAAVNRKIFAVVGHVEVPSHAMKFPLFRNGIINQQTGKVDVWWLWDGTKEWRIGKLTDDQLDLSLHSAWNDLLLIERIEQGWTPRTEEAFIQAARLKQQIQKTPTVKGIRHFLIYNAEESTEKAQQLVEAAGFKSEIIDNEPREKIILIVFQDTPLTEEYVEHVTVQLADIAAKTDGIYDAWETALG